MARSTPNVTIATDTFGHWITKTNELADLASTGAVTVAPGAGDTVSGNGAIVGTLVVTTLVANGAIRGGDLTSTNTLSVSSNLAVTGTANVSIAINVGANVTANTTAIKLGNGTVNTVIVSTGIDTDGTLAVAGNVAANGTAFVVDTANLRAGVNTAAVSNKALAVTGNTQVTGEMYVDGTLAIKTADIVANTTTITATNALTVIDSFPKSSASACKYLINIKKPSTSGRHSIEMLVMHDGTDVYATRYAELFNTSLGTFTTTIDATTVSINFTPAATGTFGAETLRIQVD
jgi:hypothetical protein